MSTVSQRWGASLVALVAVTFGLVSCADGSTEPLALSDDEQARLVDLVAKESSWINTPSCQVDVFRQDGDTTYGWATCATDANVAETDDLSQAESYPFKAVGNTVTKPGDGSQYWEDVKEIFPEDLWSAIKQH